MEKYLSANQIAEFLGLQNLAFRNGLPMASYPKTRDSAKDAPDGKNQTS